MATKEFPDDFTANASPTVSDYAFIGKRKVLLSDLAELFASDGPLLDSISSGYLTNPTVYSTNSALTRESQLWRVTAAIYAGLPDDDGSTGFRVLYAPSGVSLVPHGYPASGTINAGAAGEIVSFSPGVYIVESNGADGWGVYDCATGKLAVAGHTNLSVPVSQSGSLVDLAASSDETFLARFGSALAWTALRIGMIPDGLITWAKLPAVAAHSLVARSANTSGDAGDLTIGTDEGVFNVAGVLTSQKVKLANVDAAVQSAAQGTESLRQIATTGTASIGTANSAGNDTKAAAGNHVHDHGSQTTTTHHAVATTSGAGFMSTTQVTRQNALVQSLDPLAAFPSYQTIQTITGICHFETSNVSTLDPFIGTANSGVIGGGTAIAGRIGVINFSTSTSSTAAPNFGTSIQAFVFGSGLARYRADIVLATASDGTDTYAARFGFNDAGGTSPGDGVDGAFFRYRHSVNGGRWECVTRSNSVETATDSTVAAISASYQCLEIEVNAAGTSVVFKVNGTTVATNTTNIPTGASRATGAGGSIVKSAGTTPRSFDIDLAGYHCELTAAI